MGYCLTDGSLGEVEPCPDWVADPACFTFKVGKLLHFVKKYCYFIQYVSDKFGSETNKANNLGLI